MKKLTTLLTAAALALAFAPSFSNPASAQAQIPGAMVSQAHTMRASKLIGVEVYNEQGEDIGKLEDILVKNTMSEPQAVLSVGGFVGEGSKLGRRTAQPHLNEGRQGEHVGNEGANGGVAEVAVQQRGRRQLIRPVPGRPGGVRPAIQFHHGPSAKQQAERRGFQSSGRRPTTAAREIKSIGACIHAPDTQSDATQ